MTYFFPPSPVVFDPNVRVFRWHWADVNGQKLRYPEKEDETLFGVGSSTQKGTAPEGFFYIIPCSGFGSTNRQFHVDYAFDGWSFKKSPFDRLVYYDRMIDLMIQTFGDSILPPDDNPSAIGVLNGTRLWYVDSSDANRPKIKQVTYLPQGGKVSSKIFQTEGQKIWTGEPFDAQRETLNNMGAILAAFNALSTALLAAVSLNPALAAAWSQVLTSTEATAFTNRPPDPAQLMLSLANVLGSVPQLGTAMLDATTKNDFLASLRGTATKIYAKGETYIQSIETTAKDFAASFPTFDRSTFQGVIPPDIEKAFEANLKNSAEGIEEVSFRIALDVIAKNDPLLTLAIRKSVPDNDSFDMAYAAGIVSVNAPRHAAKGIRDPNLLVYKSTQEATITATDAKRRATLLEATRAYEKAHGLGALEQATRIAILRKTYSDAQLRDWGYAV